MRNIRFRHPSLSIFEFAVKFFPSSLRHFSKSAPRLFAFLMVGGCMAPWQGVRTGLSVSSSTEHFQLHARPDSKASVHTPRIGAAAERELARICTQLQVENNLHLTLFLFDQPDDLAKTTKVNGTGGFSNNDTSFLIYDDDPARIHEMVHLVAYARVGQAKTTFFSEGLANALLDKVPGWDVHAVARYYRQNGQLPSLAEVIGVPDFYAWMRQHPALNIYDVAGSWMRFLLDSQGVAKTKRYYVGEDPKVVFGLTLAELEAAWLRSLDLYEPSREMTARLALSKAASPVRHTVAFGETIQVGMESSASLPPAVKFQWQKDGIDLPGVTGAALTFSPRNENDSGTYLRVANNGDSKSATVFLLTAVPPHEVDGR